MEDLFDLAEEYEIMLNKGISVSGETKDFFVDGRIQNLIQSLPKGFAPKQILDFGCGTGETTIQLVKAFPNAQLIGAEIAEGAIAYAKVKNSHPNIEYIHIDELSSYEGKFDLSYTNGVFHHIPLAQRKKAFTTVFNSLRKGGYFGFFENNPVNPGTRIVMSRIPFDHDAITIRYNEGKKYLTDHGFSIDRVNFLFYFPNALRLFRPLEKYLIKLPLGAQYHILAKK